ncbi:MAG: hypothetical protein ACI9P3_000517 [Bradyrhizobium sp.]|jgi:hypothetical protein
MTHRRAFEKVIHFSHHVLDLSIGDGDIFRSSVPRLVCCADDGVIVFVWKAFHQATVAGLKRHDT